MTDFEPSKPISDAAPFFSVVIPTMNRPQLLGEAIQSVLWQSFKNFEIIISDNSNSEESTKQNCQTIEKYSHDNRLKHIRPPAWMNMPDHWEFATRHASGRYVVVLTDRFVMRPSALELLWTQITQLQDNAKLISWHSGSSFSPMGVLDTSPFTGAIEVMDSKQVFSEYAKFGNWRSSPSWANRLPRTIINCYRCDVAAEVRAKHTRLFMPINSDYTSAYLLLAYTEKTVYIDRPLFINHGNQSNSKTLLYGIKNYISTLGNGDWITGDITYFPTVTYNIARDFITAKNMVGEKYSGVNIDIIGYLMNTYREFQYLERIGSQIDIHALYEQWWEFVKTLSPEQQKLIDQHVVELQNQRSSLIGLRRLSVRLNLDPLYPFVIGAVRRIRHRLSGKPVYANVLEAARQTDYMASLDRPFELGAAEPAPKNP